jgi:hypothetical protein
MKKLLFTIGLLAVGATAFAQSHGPNATATQNETNSDKTYEFVYSEGKKVEVYDTDLPGGNCSYDDAVRKCAALGDGWRLPNAHELFSMVIQLKDKGKGNFYPGVYWSIEKYRENWYWSVDFGSRDNNSYCQFFDKNTKFVVRPVRTMK